MITQVCKICNIKKELNKENFVFIKNSKNNNKHFLLTCKLCQSLIFSEKRKKITENNLKNNIEKIKNEFNKNNLIFKNCKSCKELKLEICENFYFSNYTALFNKECKICAKNKRNLKRKIDSDNGIDTFMPLVKRNKYKKNICKKFKLNNPNHTAEYSTLTNKICNTCFISKENSTIFFQFKEFNKDGSIFYSLNRCIECKLAKNREIYNKNKKDILPIRREKLKLKSPEDKKRYSKLSQKWEKEKKKIDPAFKLRRNISQQVNKALKLSGSSKEGNSVLNYLDYTITDLKNHLESQFDETMSWPSHGKNWSIDHIQPQSSLPYTSMEDENFKKCWALSNLRPLEKIANIKKGNRPCEITSVPVTITLERDKVKK